MIETIAITHPRLPEHLNGLTIAHLSDLHIRKQRARYRRLVNQINLRGPDLILFTGDFMTDAGDEPIADQVMKRLCAELRPRMGIFGSFGNHDTPEIRRRAQQWPIVMLADQRLRLTVSPGKPALEIWGLDDSDEGFADVARLLQRPVMDHPRPDGAACDADPSETFRIVLAHNPQILPAAADMGGHLMLSGHTHGGQIRPLPHLVLTNSCDLPLGLSAGLLRHQSTLCAISRGVGEVLLPIRWFCPPHVPLYTLRRGAMLGEPTQQIRRVQRW